MKQYNKNVIITSVQLSAVGWFTGVLNAIHTSVYSRPIHWNYEISKFEAVRPRRPLPRGWNTVWDANPFKLAERGYDKIIVLYRDVMNLISAHCWYIKQKSLEAVLRDRDYRFIETIFRKYDKLQETCIHDNVYYANIFDFNNNTVRAFKDLCKYLEFEMEHFPVIIPIKVERDWEVFGGYNKGLALDTQLTKLNNIRK